MADFVNQKVVGDLGSEEVYQINNSYTELLDILGDFITGTKTAANIAAVNALAVTAETALEANVKKIVRQPAIPAGHTFPTV